MACQTCLAPLNTIGDPPVYLHPYSADTDGHQPVPVPVDRLDTVARRCDFCGDPYPVWTLVGDQVAALTLGDHGGFLQNLGHRWSACATCQHHIDSGHTDRLVERAAAALGWQHDPTGRTQVARLHTAFLRHRRPGRTLITTTFWPPTRLHARELPKARDRLATLYRSDAGLPTPLAAPHLRAALADSLDRATLYWIDPDFTDLTEHAAAQLPDTTLNAVDVPGADGLLVWCRPITTRDIIAASWTRAERGWRLVVYRSIGGGLDGVPLQRIREQIGWLVPMRTVQVGWGELVDHPQATPLVASWLLIAQRLDDTTPAAAEPAIRKAYARARRPAPEVTVVRIRGHAAHTAETPSSAATSRTFTQRFWVSGHWRNQAYGPGRALRRPVYIHPFLKGPDDRPIQQTSTVRVLGTHRHPDGTASA
jgi:hypothetical protein